MTTFLSNVGTTYSVTA